MVVGFILERHFTSRAPVCALLFCSIFLLTGCPDQPKLTPVTASAIAPDAAFARIMAHGRHVEEPQGWVTDIWAAIDGLKLSRNNENMCAVMAIIEQESGFKEDPPVSGLSGLLSKKIAKMEENLVMYAALEVRLNQVMPNSKLTFKKAIKNIKTERDLAHWYEAFTEAQFTGLILDQMGKGVDKLVSTVGSMQVSIDFARKTAQKLGKSSVDMRETLYTREGGVFYGTAHLLYYPAHYDDVVYRFADFNAGQYSSRNAGFQMMVAQLTGKKIDPDGALIDHREDDGTKRPSQTVGAITALFAKKAKNITPVMINADLEQARSIKFEDTDTYKTVVQLMQAEGRKPITQMIPRISLKSEKITRQLTTEWYANSVNGRYKRCMSAVK